MARFISIQEQLEEARAESEGKVTITLIDVCLGSYLQDHHNRDGEMLLGVYVNGGMTVSDVLGDLKMELRESFVEDGERGGYDHAAAEAALEALIAKNAENADAIFDTSLERPPVEEDFDSEEEFEAASAEWDEAQDMSESCQAWFLFHWEVPEDDD